MWKIIVIALTIPLAGIAMLFLQLFDIGSLRSYIFIGIAAFVFLLTLFTLEYFTKKKAVKK